MCKNFKEKVCVVCGETFKTNHGTKKYCSDKCKKIAEKNLKKLSNIRCREHIKEYQANYRNKNKEKLQIYYKEWRLKNKKHLSEYQKKYYTTINNKIKKWSYYTIARCIKSKSKHTFNILNYTPNQLREHLESKFKNGMTWENHGIVWHIDHIKPLCAFNFILENGEIDYEQIKVANSLENLQPLLANDNFSKSGKY